jgi:hypothetical protein
MEPEISQAPENEPGQGSNPTSSFVSVVNETYERESVRKKYSHLIKRFGDSPKKCSLPKVTFRNAINVRVWGLFNIMDKMHHPHWPSIK